ncbi:MAG TPA: glycoside hydrolase family 3 C-terminal domain-containing protein [Nannocystaceae bacterium]|nr:glycoside hydrolase family 3 C-terminal domain-containing protein [Nannocystaceae bacterium]
MIRLRTRWSALVAVLACGCGDDGAAAPGTSSDDGVGETTTTSAPTTSSADGSSSTDGSESTTTDGGDDADARARYCGAQAEAIEARIDAALAAMSVADKVAMMHGASLFVEDGLWRVDGNEAQGLPGFHMLDGPRGVSSVTGGTATVFPVGMLRGATWDPMLERELGAAVAREIRSYGGDVVLAPTLNILRHPRWGRAQETYGEDTVHLGAMGVGFIEGAQSERVIATAKHYAANSIEDTRFVVDVTLDERSLREIYLPHFRRAVVDANVGSMMSAYNLVDGLHCDVNPHLLRDILGDDWRFQGFVMSDWVQGTHGDVEAVRAGLDVEMPNGAHFAGLASAVADGALEESELDESLRGTLRAQLCFALDTDPAVPDPTQRETAEHLELAERVAERGIVLLRNEGVLPLDRATLGEIVVAGALADVENIGDDGSSAVEPADVVTALEGLVDRAGAVTITPVLADVLAPADEATIMGADVVVVVLGLTADDEGEGLIAAGDRESLAVPAAQLELLQSIVAIGTPTIVVLEGGGPLLTSAWIDDTAAVLMAWYPGQQGGFAIADILFGDAEPSGRLPASFPVAEADLPEFDNVSESVEYGYLHGYRWLDANATAPAFPFGFGLAYTTFAYDAITLDAESIDASGTITATIDVSNTGMRSGIATVQLYVAMPASSFMRAPKDLRGFAQIELAAGESSTVAIPIAAADLAVWDTDAGAWTVEPGAYEIQIGADAATLPLSAGFTIE